MIGSVLKPLCVISIRIESKECAKKESLQQHAYLLKVHEHHQVLKNWPQTAFVLGPEDDHSQSRHEETSLPAVQEYQHQTCCSATRDSQNEILLA